MKTRFGFIYFVIVLIISSIAIFLFTLVFVYNVMPVKLRPLGMEAFVSFIQSLAGIFNAVFVSLFACHLLVLIYRSIFGVHSLFWLMFRNGFTLFYPLFTFVLINVLNGKLNNEMISLLVGVVSGILSSTIVLILDRNHQLVNSILKIYAPDLIEKTEVIDESETES